MPPGTTRAARRAAWMLCFLLLIAADSFAQSSGRGGKDQKSNWVLDHVETFKNQEVPLVIVSDNGTTYTRTVSWSKIVPNQYGVPIDSKRSTDTFQVTESWSSPPQQIEYGKEGSLTVNYFFNSSPALDEYNHRNSLVYEFAVTAAAYNPAVAAVRFVWKSDDVRFIPFVEGGTSAQGTVEMADTPTDGQLELFYSKDSNFHPDGSWWLTVDVWTSIQDDSLFGSNDPYGDNSGKYKANLEITRRYWYRFEGPDYETIDEDIVLPPDDDDNPSRGDFGGLVIPLSILGIVATGFIVNRSRKTRKAARELEKAVVRGTTPEPPAKKIDKKKKDTKKKQPKEEEEETPAPPSTYQIILYKDFSDTLVVGDEPVTLGARIEEITPEGVRKERPDMTRSIWISAEEHCTVTKQRFDGRYMTGQVTAERNPDDSCPDTATVLVAFNGPKGRLLTHVHCRVEDMAAILVGPNISFAAGEGKTLDMEFLLYGAASSPEGLQITLDQAGYKHFNAELEQDEKNPDLFRIHLTESGEDKDIPGTIEDYLCRIEVTPRGKRPPVVETFTINRIHLGFHVELRALKGFLVELESTFDHDILPPRGSHRRLKYAESRVDMMLMVVDEEHDSQIRPVSAKELDKAPEFKFEDEFHGSTLFTSKGFGEHFTPGEVDLEVYEDLFFRDPDGQNVPSPCKLLNFKYEPRGRRSDGAFWGVIKPSSGFLVAPNRSHAKVTVTVTWKGKEYTEEHIVPLNSQPYRIVDVPPGGDLNQALNQYAQLDAERMEKLRKLRRKICLDHRFMELRPLFYKISVMIEGHDDAFGFDDIDYENIMSVFERFADGQIGAYFAVKDTVSEEGQEYDITMSALSSWEKSIPVIVCRIGLGIVTGGASELIFTPLSAVIEMDEYVKNGGQSAWESFKQISVNILKWEGLFFGLGQVGKWAGGRVKKFMQVRAEKASQLARNTKQLGSDTKKVLDTTKFNKSLSGRRPYSSAPRADRIASAGRKVKDAVNRSKDMADDAIRNMRENAENLFKEESKFAQECANRARKDAQKILDDFKNVMNDPTATKEQARRVTLALQGNKTAQKLLGSQPSDLLRANFNAQMKQIYKEVDELTVKNLTKELERLGFKDPKLKLMTATGNSEELLTLGKKVAKDRDFTWAMQNGKTGKWVDLPEEMMEDAYAKAFNKTQYDFIPTDRKEMIKTLTKADQAAVNGAFGAESYGDDLERIINPARQAEKLTDVNRVAETYVHKSKEWFQRAADAEAQGRQLIDGGLAEEGMHVIGYSQSLVEEGVYQNVKQFNRIFVPRLEAAVQNGAKVDYTNLMAKMRILQGLGNPPPAGVEALTLEEARIVLKNSFGTTFEQVVEEGAEAIREINALL